MIFVADENIDIEIIVELRERGFHVLSISEDFPGIPDEDVLKTANDHKAVLLTGDKDFGELVFRRGMVSSGVVLIRIFGVSQEEKVRIIREAFRNHADDFVENFTVISKKKMRIKEMD